MFDLESFLMNMDDPGMVVFGIFVVPYLVVLLLGLVNRIRISRLIKAAEREGRVVKAYLLHFNGNIGSTDPEDRQGVAEYKYHWKGQEKKFRLHVRANQNTYGTISLYYAPNSNKMYSRQDQKGGDIMLLIPIIFLVELVIIIRFAMTGGL